MIWCFDLFQFNSNNCAKGHIITAVAGGTAAGGFEAFEVKYCPMAAMASSSSPFLLFCWVTTGRKLWLSGQLGTLLLCMPLLLLTVTPNLTRVFSCHRL